MERDVRMQLSDQIEWTMVRGPRILASWAVEGCLARILSLPDAGDADVSTAVVTCQR